VRSVPVARLCFHRSLLPKEAHKAAATKMKIVRAKPEDADRLTEIAHASKRHWNYPEHWIEGWRDILTMKPDFIAANIAYCAIEDRRAVGFYALTREQDGLHLDHLWVLPAAMHRGIGRALFEHAAEQARNLRFQTIKIEADPNAEGFYQRMGTKRIGTRVNEIDCQKRQLPLLEFRISSPT
jgi:ribosomal protein S18 acetylase RimI-like enzyme